MTLLYVGAVIDRLPTLRYCEQLAFCELAPRTPLPRVATLRRWWHHRKYAIEIALVAPRSSFVCAQGAARLDALPEAQVQWLIEAAGALNATYVLLPTGRDITPSARDRERLAQYCAHLAERSGRPIVWAPGGLWESEAAAREAERMQVGLALDVLEHAPSTAQTLYARAAGVGVRARLGQGHLDMAVEAVCHSGAGTAYLAIDADPPVRKALAALATARGLAEGDDSLRLASPTRLSSA